MNRKLLTPVQFEPVLGGLNKARPLSLVDEGRVILSDPVLDMIPVDDDRPVQGKFLRGNGESAPRFNPNLYTDYHFAEHAIEASDYYNYEPVYDPPVQGILLEVGMFTEPCWCDWYDPTITIFLKRYIGLGCYWIPFVGSKICIRLKTGIGGALGVRVYAFYGKDI